MYDQREKAQRDHSWLMEGIRKEGLEEGGQQGIHLGRVKGMEQGLEQGLEQGVLVGRIHPNVAKKQSTTAFQGRRTGKICNCDVALTKRGQASSPVA